MEVLKRIYKNKFKDIPLKDKDAFSYLINNDMSKEDIIRDIESTIGMEYYIPDKEKIDIVLLTKFNLSELQGKRLMPLFIEEEELHFVTDELVDKKLKGYANDFAKEVGLSKINLDKFIMNFDFDNLLESSYKGLTEKELVKNKEESKQEISNEESKNGIFDVEKIADNILERGFANRASDIHIEPLKEGLHVRYRIDGLFGIIDPYDFTKRQSQELINHFKVRSALNVTEKRKGQDGNMKDITFKGNKYDIRISTISGVLGEKIVMRILEKNFTIPTFKDLGFSNFYINTISNDLSKKHGLILNTGSVGSGKSTTQTTILSGLNAKEKNIYSIEDPVERTIDYVNHIDVKETSVTFEKHLETLLRQDPDIIAIGEIRELTTMNMAIKAALTGQLVFATLHTNSAMQAFQRIFEMGVEAYEFGAAIEGIGSQRLVRILCPHCKVKKKTTDDEKEKIEKLILDDGINHDMNMGMFEYLYTHQGCEECNHTGYKGRTVIAEYLSTNSDIKEYISGGHVTREKLLEMSEDSFLPIEMDAINKILLGVTTISEVIKVV